MREKYEQKDRSMKPVGVREGTMVWITRNKVGWVVAANEVKMFSRDNV